MVDIVDKKSRSQMMAGIRGKDTRPELFIRKQLHKAGFRYSLHVASLSGKPDLVFKKYKAVIFVNGCFWHGHGCHLFKFPGSHAEFWKKKIEKTKETDKGNFQKLHSAGWRILYVWECAIKGKERLDPEILISKIENWLRSENDYENIRGICHEVEK